MEKVIKIIDLLNMIAKGEELPKKIKIYGEEFSLEENSKCYSYYDWNMGIKHFLFARLNNESLNNEVEILDEEDEIDIQRIEEIDLESVIPSDDKSGIALLHVNKLIKAVKQLDNKLKEK